MGNWRRVELIGTCDASEVRALRAAIDPGRNYDNFHCLSSGSGICGIGDWAGETINRVGNLAERDYGPDDVAEALRQLVKVAPSLALVCHCGDDYEADNCIATVTARNGEVAVVPPLTEKLPELDKGQMEKNLHAAMFNRR
jgi:hypothetical protein